MYTYVSVSVSVYIYIYRYWRKFGSQIFDKMDRWQSRMGRVRELIVGRKRSERRKRSAERRSAANCHVQNQWNIGKPMCWQTHIPYHEVNDRWWGNDLAQSECLSRKAEALYYSKSGFFECDDACQKAYDKASWSKLGELGRLRL